VPDERVALHRHAARGREGHDLVGRPVLAHAALPLDLAPLHLVLGRHVVEVVRGRRRVLGLAAQQARLQGGAHVPAAGGGRDPQGVHLHAAWASAGSDGPGDDGPSEPHASAASAMTDRSD
jgi:hypothetical protein